MLYTTFEEAVQTYKTGTPSEKGLLTGVIVTEIIAAAMGVAELRQAAKLAKAGQMTRTMEKLIERPVMQAPARQTLCSRLRDKLKAFREWIDPWCFVAGTLVATPAGAVPIESVRAGDLVWSRDPDTFLTEPRPVRETYVSHPAEWFHVGVDRDGDHRADETISGTGSHPWYVLTPGRVGFVPARELQAGDILSLRDGTRAWVTDKTREVAPPGQTFTTYNFAVADHHTYFAGEGGVWVHNTCKELLEDIVALNKTHLDELGDHDEAVKKALEAVKPDTYKGKLVTNPNRMQTGSLLYEQNPNVINAAVSDDTAIANRFLDETNLRVQNPTNSRKPQPVSIARAGDGQQPFIASPKARMPDEWGAELVDDLDTVLLQNSDALGWTDEALNNAGRAASHSEALSLMRMRKELGDLSQFDEIHLTTAGRHVCGYCVSDDGTAGLAEIAQALGVRRLIVHADVDPLSGARFQDLGNLQSVVIEAGEVLLD